MNEPTTLPHVKAGKLVLLAINGPVRNPDFPDIPTLTEAGVPDADIPLWFGFFAPAGTPREIITKMNGKMVELARTDEFKRKLWLVNTIAAPQSPEGMAADLDKDIKINAELIKAANIKIE